MRRLGHKELSRFHWLSLVSVSLSLETFTITVLSLSVRKLTMEKRPNEQVTQRLTEVPKVPDVPAPSCLCLI